MGDRESDARGAYSVAGAAPLSPRSFDNWRIREERAETNSVIMQGSFNPRKIALSDRWRVQFDYRSYFYRALNYLFVTSIYNIFTSHKISKNISSSINLQITIRKYVFPVVLETLFSDEKKVLKLKSYVKRTFKRLEAYSLIYIFF